LKAQADLEAARAELAKISNDANSQNKTENAKNSIVQEIIDAYTQADDAIHNKTDQFFENPSSPNPEINFAFEDKNGLKDSINNRRIFVEELLSQWKVSVSKLNITTYTSFDLENAKKNLSSILSFLNDVAKAVNDFEVNSSLTQASIDKYRSDTALARANINASVSALITAGDKLRESVSDVPVQTARVLSAEASVASYKADLDKTTLRAPFTGIVSKQDAKVGESVSANSVVSSVISTNYEIETYVPEVSISGVSVGNSAKVTLDAYGKDAQFDANVIHIDPAETVKDGVSTYKVNLVFSTPDARIKSGMTTNIDIETMRKSGTLLIPKRAILEKDNQKIVLVKTSSKDSREQVIEVGLSDSKGNVEVVSGINQDDLILLNPTK
jgi:HlyD family secretion protein